MKKIVPIAGVFLCLMFIIVATPRAQVPRVAIELQQRVYPWGATWGIVQLRFPLGSLTVSPTVGISDYGLSSILKYLYVGINASTSTRLLQLETAYMYLATGGGLQPFYNGTDSASLGIGAGVGWSPSSFLDIQAGVDSALMLKSSYLFPLRLHVMVRISWPLF